MEEKVSHHVAFDQIQPEGDLLDLFANLSILYTRSLESERTTLDVWSKLAMVP